MSVSYILFSRKHCKLMRPCVAENYGFVRYELPFINALAVEVPEDKVEAIRQHHLVAGLARDASVTKLPICEDKGESSSLGSIAMPKSDNAVLRKMSLLESGGFGTTIAVVDTGVAPHYDLVKPYNRIVAFKDFVNHKIEPYDDDGHGTHVAGIAAGNGYCAKPYYPENYASPNCDSSDWNVRNMRNLNSFPHAGTAPMANIAALKALDENGGGRTSDILAAMQWIADNKEKFNIRVVNLSLGVSVYEHNPLDPLVIASAALTAMGILVVAAAGNGGPGRCTITSPGISPVVLTVGSCHNGAIPSFSSRGPTLIGLHKPDLVAPGVDIMSLDAATGKTYIAHSGTSMSCPYVSGIAASIISAQPHLTPKAVRSIISKMLQPLKSQHRDAQGLGALVL